MIFFCISYAAIRRHYPMIVDQLFHSVDSKGAVRDPLRKQNKSVLWSRKSTCARDMGADKFPEAVIYEIYVITLRLRQDARLFAADIYKRIFLNENHYDLIQISLKIVPGGPIENKSWSWSWWSIMIMIMIMITVITIIIIIIIINMRHHQCI